jgi:hypothetical protein
MNRLFDIRNLISYKSNYTVVLAIDNNQGDNSKPRTLQYISTTPNYMYGYGGVVAIFKLKK